MWTECEIESKLDRVDGFGHDARASPFSIVLFIPFWFQESREMARFTFCTLRSSAYQNNIYMSLERYASNL